MKYESIAAAFLSETVLRVVCFWHMQQNFLADTDKPGASWLVKQNNAILAAASYGKIL